MSSCCDLIFCAFASAFKDKINAVVVEVRFGYAASCDCGYCPNICRGEVLHSPGLMRAAGVKGYDMRLVLGRNEADRSLILGILASCIAC
jgi:hypothetical protein